MAPVTHIQRSTNMNAILAIQILERIQDLLADHTLCVRLIRITCKHGRAAPSEPFAAKATGCVDVGRVMGVEIERVILGVGIYARSWADRFAETRTALVTTDLSRESDCGCGGR